MRISGMGMRRWAGAAGLSLGAALLSVQAFAEDRLGQPTPGAIDLQPAASKLKHEAIFFHNGILMPIITGITLVVLALLLWVIFRYNKRANPTPARWSHNTLIEIIWTVVPVLILMFIAIFSFKLLFAYHDMPKPDLTVKVVGRQWNWDYEYPDQGVSAFTSEMATKEAAAARGAPFRLAATEAMVVPVGKNVRVLVTAEDVIHAFALPAFGLKTDAVPGRVNETFFNAEKIGTYYGQCSELCGKDHAFMPIEIRVVSEADFAAWVATKGGSMTKAAPAGPSSPEPAVVGPATPANEAASQGGVPAAPVGEVKGATLPTTGPGAGAAPAAASTPQSPAGAPTAPRAQ
jgi:cytochrome c oxidase subunit 2